MGQLEYDQQGLYSQGHDELEIIAALGDSRSFLAYSDNTAKTRVALYQVSIHN